MEPSFIYHHEKSGAVAVARFTWSDGILYPLASSTAARWWELLPETGDITTNDSTSFVSEVIAARFLRRRAASVTVKHASVLLSTYEQRLESGSIDCSRCERFPKLNELLRRARLDDASVLAFLAGIHTYKQQRHAITPVVSSIWERQALLADIDY